MKRVFVIAALESARLLCLFLAALLCPQPQSDSNDALVYKEAFPIGALGLIGVFALTALIAITAPRYGLASSIIIGLLSAFGAYVFLDYWHVLR